MSYRKLSPNKYIIEVEKRINGKRRRKTKRITTDLKGKDLQYLITKIEKELSEILQSETAYNLSNVNFKEFAEYFLKIGTFRQRTKDYYQDYLNQRTLDAIGELKLSEIKKHHIEQFIQKLRTEISPATGKPLAPKTIKHYRDTIRVILNKAKELEIIKDNPTDNIKIPPVTRTIEGRYYEAEEVEQIIKALQEEGEPKYYIFYTLQLFTGARPSEMYGLKW